MVISTDDCIRIAENGGNIIIKSDISTDDCIRIVKVLQKNKTLTLKNCKKSTYDCIRILKSVKFGEVFFEF